MSRKIALVTILICGLVSLSNQNHVQTLFKTINALQKTLQFINDNKHKFNLDGLFGIILLKANLGSLPFALKTSLYIKKLDEEATQILSDVDLTKKNLDINYKTIVKHLFNVDIWVKNASYKNGLVTVLTDRFPIKNGECERFIEYVTTYDSLDESQSDFCIAQLINSSISDTKKCQISNFCKTSMIDETAKASGYSVTHKLLYLQISRIRNCRWGVSKWLENKVKRYCSYIYWEAKSNAECQFVSSLDDLFLEQIVLCGYEGYSDFFQKKWINHVLELQTNEGCFTSSQRNHIRNKREYNDLPNGCQDHITGLGAAALSLFLKFLLLE